jgi:hypothetical protein
MLFNDESMNFSTQAAALAGRQRFEVACLALLCLALLEGMAR